MIKNVILNPFISITYSYKQFIRLCNILLILNKDVIIYKKSEVKYDNSILYIRFHYYYSISLCIKQHTLVVQTRENAALNVLYATVSAIFLLPNTIVFTSVSFFLYSANATSIVVFPYYLFLFMTKYFFVLYIVFYLPQSIIQPHHIMPLRSEQTFCIKTPHYFFHLYRS